METAENSRLAAEKASSAADTVFKAAEAAAREAAEAAAREAANTVDTDTAKADRKAQAESVSGSAPASAPTTASASAPTTASGSASASASTTLNLSTPTPTLDFSDDKAKQELADWLYQEAHIHSAELCRDLAAEFFDAKGSSKELIKLIDGADHSWLADKVGQRVKIAFDVKIYVQSIQKALKRIVDE